MLRILLWRIAFELLNLLKILSFRGATTRYFAFGANLDPDKLESRRIRIYSQRPYLLSEYALVFDQQGPYVGGGFASLSYKPGSVVFGLIYEISWIDGLRMDCYEASLFLKKYVRKTLTSVDAGEFFYYRATKSTEGLLPTASYLKLIENAYSRHAEGQQLLSQLKENEVLSNLTLAKNINFLVANYDEWPKWLRPFLMLYDRWCLSVFVYFITRQSFLERRVPI